MLNHCNIRVTDLLPLAAPTLQPSLTNHISVYSIIFIRSKASSGFQNYLFIFVLQKWQIICAFKKTSMSFHHNFLLRLFQESLQLKFMILCCSCVFCIGSYWFSLDLVFSLCERERLELHNRTMGSWFLPQGKNTRGHSCQEEMYQHWFWWCPTSFYLISDVIRHKGDIFCMSPDHLHIITRYKMNFPNGNDH
jgi:hypothetical protein